MTPPTKYDAELSRLYRQWSEAQLWGSAADAKAQEPALHESITRLEIAVEMERTLFWLAALGEAPVPESVVEALSAELLAEHMASCTSGPGGH